MLIGSKIPPQADIIKFVIAGGDPRVAVRGVTHLPFLETADVNPLNTTRREENYTGNSSSRPNAYESPLPLDNAVSIRCQSSQDMTPGKIVPNNVFVTIP